jgi:uncharacterized membrane protein
MEALLLQIVGSIMLPSIIAAGGAIGWFHKFSSKHMDDKFSDLSKQIENNDLKIERLERDILDLQIKLPKEFVMREEFMNRMNDGTKKMDYLVEQVDVIKNLLMSVNPRA